MKFATYCITLLTLLLIPSLASGATATASSEYSSSYAATGTIDGEHDGNNYGAGGVWADGTPGTFPDSLQVAFGSAQSVSSITIYTLKDDFNSGSTVNDATTFTAYGITAFDVQYWNGSAWVTLATVTGNNLVKRTFTFSAVSTDKIRVVVNDSADHYFSRIAEVEYSATVPSPTPTPSPSPTPTPCPSCYVSPTPPPNAVFAPQQGDYCQSDSATATASSELAGYPAISAIQGDRRGDIDFNVPAGARSWGHDGGWANAVANTFPAWLQCTFGRPHSVGSVVVVTFQDNYNPGHPHLEPWLGLQVGGNYTIEDFEIQVLDMNDHWITVADIEENYDIMVWPHFPAITAKAVRVVVNDSYGGYARIISLEAYAR